MTGVRLAARLAVAGLRRDRWSGGVRLVLLAALVAGLLGVLGGEVQKRRLIDRRFEQPDLRTVEVVAVDGGRLDPATADIIGAVQGVRWALGVTDVYDVRADGPTGEERIASAIETSGPMPAAIGLGRPLLAGQALVTPAAGAQLGLTDGVGPVIDRRGDGTAVIGRLRVASGARFLDGSVLVRGPRRPLRSVQVGVRTLDDVDRFTTFARRALHDLNGRAVVVRAPDGLDDLRDQVADTVGAESGTTLVISLLAVAGATAVLMALRVRGNRPAIARRRCLGASRRVVAGTVVIETVGTVIAGFVVGGLAAELWLRATGRPVVGVDVLLACLAILATTATGLSVVPAALAARVDAARILRTP